MKTLAVLMVLALLGTVGVFAGKALAAEPDKNMQTVIFPAGSQGAFKGPDAWFTGTVRVDMLFPDNKVASYGGAIVTFAPGARTAWHAHPAGQRLIITEGVGWVQEWGGPVVEVKAGDSVWFPPGVKHWHGASPDEGMQHIALSGVENGKNSDWMEKVSDEQYHK